MKDFKRIFYINWFKFIRLNYFYSRIKRQKGYIVPFFGSKILIDKGSILNINNCNVFIGEHSEMATRKKTFVKIINKSKMTCKNRLGIGQGAYVHVNYGGELIIGGGAIGNDSKIGCELKIVIGNNFLCGRGVNIRDNDSHKIMRFDGTSNTPSEIVIGNNVWICDKCTILKGTKIGNDSVLGTDSLICGVVPSHVCVVNKREMLFSKIESWKK